MRINNTKNYISPSNKKKNTTTREAIRCANELNISFSDKALKLYLEDLLKNDTKLAILQENDLDFMMIDSNSNSYRNPYVRYLKYLSVDL